MIKKVLFILLLSFGMVACEGGSDSEGGTGGNPPSPAPQPQPESEQLKWGDLQCQIEENCGNPVLNLPLPNLVSFLERNFSLVQSSPDSDFSAFLCGSDFIQLWSEQFLRIGSLNGENLEAVADFGQGLLNLSTCSLTEEYLNKIIKYFENTKEYQSEL